MSGLLESLWGWAKVKWEEALKWVQELKGVKRLAVDAGAVLTGVCVVAGAPLSTYAIAGIVVNYLLWSVFHELPFAMDIIARHGRAIDIAYTVGSITLGGVTLGGWLVGLMASGYFTLFRQYNVADWLEQNPSLKVEIEAKEKAAQEKRAKAMDERARKAHNPPPMPAEAVGVTQDDLIEEAAANA